VKRGGESTTLGLVEYLRRHVDLTVLAGGPWPGPDSFNLGFPPCPARKHLYAALPAFARKIMRRLHADPLSCRNRLFCKQVLAHPVPAQTDLLIFRSVGPWGAKAGRSIRRQRGIPFVTIEGGWRKGERETARYHPNLHIAVNPEVAEYLRLQLPDVRVEYIPNGIDVQAYDPEGPVAEIDLPRPLFLGCGHIDAQKRWELAIQAVARLPRGSLMLLGKGDQENALRTFGHRQLGNRFRISSVPYEHIGDYYRAADVVTLPSSGESFGMVYVEAMACNKPVVATCDKNRIAIVGNGGILVDPTDLEAYAQALQQAAQQDFGDAPRQQAGQFDWQQIGPHYLKVFEETAAHPEPPEQGWPVHRMMGD
jgi:glycosyltransferase involved in cell wall biosynthesis